MKNIGMLLLGLLLVSCLNKNEIVQATFGVEGMDIRGGIL